MTPRYIIVWDAANREWHCIDRDGQVRHEDVSLHGAEAWVLAQEETS